MEAAQVASEAKQKSQKISKFSWADEEAKVKIYIDTNQFKGTITEAMVDVQFDEYKLEITVVDEEGVNNVLTFAK